MSTMGDDFYAAWHEALGSAEHRVTITMAGYGDDAESGERFLEGFLARCPDSGPVVSQDAVEDSIAVTFSTHARDEAHAWELAKLIWIAGATESGLVPNDILRLEIEAVKQAEADTSELARA